MNIYIYKQINIYICIYIYNVSTHVNNYMYIYIYIIFVVCFSYMASIYLHIRCLDVAAVGGETTLQVMPPRRIAGLSRCRTRARAEKDLYLYT